MKAPAGRNPWLDGRCFTTADPISVGRPDRKAVQAAGTFEGLRARSIVGRRIDPTGPAEEKNRPIFGPRARSTDQGPLLEGPNSRPSAKTLKPEGELAEARGRLDCRGLRRGTDIIVCPPVSPPSKKRTDGVFVPRTQSEIVAAGPLQLRYIHRNRGRGQAIAAPTLLPPFCPRQPGGRKLQPLSGGRREGSPFGQFPPIPTIDL